MPTRNGSRLATVQSGRLRDPRAQAVRDNAPLVVSRLTLAGWLAAVVCLLADGARGTDGLLLVASRFPPRRPSFDFGLSQRFNSLWVALRVCGTDLKPDVLKQLR